MHFSKPVIAAVNGYAVAGGLELACLCDIRVVEEDATFGVFCRRFGVPLYDGGTQRLPRLIGLSHALDMIITGRPVGAQEAYNMGLANRVVPTGTARAEAEKIAHQLAAFPRKCMNSDRQCAYEFYNKDLRDALQLEFYRGVAVINSGETAAGGNRFASGKGRSGNFEDL
jgi:enoyl-CoA hydratase